MKNRDTSTMGQQTITDRPVCLADGLTKTQVKAFRLLANQSANWAQWDNDLKAVRP
jgi:hypothetical protein